MPFIRFILFLFLFRAAIPASAGEAVIFGSDPGYRGKTVHLFIPGNPFLPLPRHSDTVVCDENGRFRFTLRLERGTFVYLETGVYEGSLYAEPGHRYHIGLPPYREKRYTDLVSPFFAPVRFHLEVLSKTGLDGSGHAGGPEGINHSLFRFDTLFSRVNEEVITLRRLGLDSRLDSVIRAMEASFAEDTSLVFRDYRKYKYGILKMNEGRSGLEEIGREYLGPEIRDEHPVFMQLFNLMYREFLFYFSRTEEGAGIRDVINRTHQLDTLRRKIRLHASVTSDTLADLVLLRELYTAFHQGAYHKEAILILLDSMAGDPVIPRYGAYAAQIRQKLSNLMVGSAPPAFVLTDTGGNPYSLADSEGKYVLLVFCTPEHYGCMMEYPFMQSYLARHAEYLDVVSVMVAEQREEVAQFMERNGYTWKALYYKDHPGILRDYEIRAFPVAYLIGPNGRLVLSPAPLPSEGFEQQLFRIMRSRGEV